MLITWGYAALAHAGLIGQSGTLLASYPDVLMATIAGLLLVGVGIVSARAARRRMRYETWYFLHFYTYLAIALAFSHQFADGAEFVANRPARVLWSALYLAVGLALLWYRFLVPVRQTLRHRFRVEGVYREGPGVVSIVISGDPPGRAARRGGAVLPVALPDPRPVVGLQPVLAVGGAATKTGCASPSRTSASTARRCRGCGREPGCWPRARTAR